jgi:hypothetical protein
MPGQLATLGDPRSQRRTEDLAHEDRQNQPHDDSHNVPESQLLH